MPGSLSSGFLCSLWRGKRSRHSRHIRNPQFYVSGKRHINKQNINTSRPRSNGCHFADESFKCIFLNENVWISVRISLKLVPNGPIYRIPALVDIMTWRGQGNKPLSESIMVRFLTHICVIRPQWVNNASWHDLKQVKGLIYPRYVCVQCDANVNY